ncbi:MAG: hypothetical protein IPL83_07545 [Bdellovibrionales bacterium]|nr:hypothetical protein [Bdellovibrionales bacterium]
MVKLIIHLIFTFSVAHWPALADEPTRNRNEPTCQPMSIEDEFKISKNVFSGKVIKVENSVAGDVINYQISFDVTNVYKGAVTKRAKVIYKVIKRPTVSFIPSHEYVVFSSDDKEPYMIDPKCRNTGLSKESFLNENKLALLKEKKSTKGFGVVSLTLEFRPQNAKNLDLVLDKNRLFMKQDKDLVKVLDGVGTDAMGPVQAFSISPSGRFILVEIATGRSWENSEEWSLQDKAVFYVFDLQSRKQIFFHDNDVCGVTTEWKDADLLKFNAEGCGGYTGMDFNPLTPEVPPKRTKYD